MTRDPRRARSECGGGPETTADSSASGCVKVRRAPVYGQPRHQVKGAVYILKRATCEESKDVKAQHEHKVASDISSYH